MASDDVTVHTAGESGPVVIVIPGFIQNQAAFAVADRDMPAELALEGFRVWSLELSGEGAPDLLTYAEQIGKVVRAARAESERVGVLGHSMGGILAVGLDDAARERITSFATIGAPLLPGFRGALATTRSVAALGRYLARRGQPFRGRAIGRLLRATRTYSDHPMAAYPFRIWRSRSTHPDILDAALGESFRDDSWNAFADMLELTASGGERAGRLNVGERLRSLRHPLLVIAGDRDGLAPPDATRPLFVRAGSVDKRFVMLGQARCGQSFGHIDLLVGDHAHDFVLPELLAHFKATLMPSA